MVKLYIIEMYTLYWLKNAKEPLSENQYLRQIHGIIDSLCKSYLFAQVKKQNYRVFWKIRFSYMGILKYSLVIQKWFFSHGFEYSKKLLERSKI